MTREVRDTVKLIVLVVTLLLLAGLAWPLLPDWPADEPAPKGSEWDYCAEPWNHPDCEQRW